MFKDQSHLSIHEVETRLELQNNIEAKSEISVVRFHGSENHNKWRDEIPQVLLDLIAQHITTLEDFCRFHGVCSSWRMSAVRSNYFVDTVPWFMIMPGTRDDQQYCFYDLSTGNTYQLHHLQHAMSRTGIERLTISEAGHGWLVIHEPSPIMSWAHLFNPLTNAQFNLPPIPGAYFTEMVVTSNPNKENDFVVLIYCSNGVPGYHITHVGDAGSVQNWTQVDDALTESICIPSSFVSHKGRFYALNTKKNTVVSIDGTSVLPAMMDVAQPGQYGYRFDDVYLVSRAEDLLICVHSPQFMKDGEKWPSTWKWQVYSVKIKGGEKGELIKMESLEDGAIFITDKFSHYVSTLNTSPGDPYRSKCRKNCIYFQSIGISWKVGESVIWECNLEDGTTKPFYSYKKISENAIFSSGYIIPNIWFVPNLW